MAVQANIIANKFLELGKLQGKSLTNMQVQKLVYIAQGFHLGFYGEPLYFDTTHAWQWGPVIPKLYKALQQYGSGVVENNVPENQAISATLPKESQEMISAVWEVYGEYSGSQLSALTHQKNTPWSKTWQEKPFGVIPIERIEEYYRAKVQGH